MKERVITTRRGVYGRVNITLPLPVKNSLMDIQKKSGMKKAEFLRVALMLGTARITESVLSPDRKTGCSPLAQQSARRNEDSLLAQAGTQRNTERTDNYSR